MRWSINFAQCKKCGTKSKIGQNKHHGHGLCKRCYDHKRNAQPKRKAYLLKRFAQLPPKKYNPLKFQRYKMNNPKAYKAKYTRKNLRKKFKNFILFGPAKIENNTLKFRCDGCEKHCLINTCIQSPKRKGDQTYTGILELEKFKEILIKYCKIIKKSKI